MSLNLLVWRRNWWLNLLKVAHFTETKSHFMCIFFNISCLISRFGTFPLCLCLFSDSWGVHRHVETRRGYGVHAGGCQPLPNVSQRFVHERADSRAEGQHRRSQTLVWGGPVHQPDPCQDHAEAGKTLVFLFYLSARVHSESCIYSQASPRVQNQWSHKTKERFQD